jgi:DNA (cytosine-5)-methyltransferase 1
MNFGSVCSGIEAASVAWGPLDWRCAFTSEIERFPSAVLKHRWPDTPNLGDMNEYKSWPDIPIDILAGGTPCQSFSVAGLRAGLADPRGNLTLTFLAVVERYAPRWFVWENVPGVLSVDEGRVFGSFLGGLAKLRYGFAYRILDAQYFGLAQRRERVFVVGCAGGQWQRAAAVLFERESLCGNPAPGRESWQRVALPVTSCVDRGGSHREAQGNNLIAPTFSSRTKGGGGLGTDFDLDGGVIPIQEIGKRQSGTAMNGVGHGKSGDPMFTLQSSAVHGVCATLTKNYATHHGRTAGNNGGVAENQLIAFSSKDSGADAATEIAPTLRAGNHDKSHANSGSHIAIAHTLKADGFDASEDGIGRGVPLVPETARCVATREGTSQDYETTTIIPAGMAVRRLTPRECERLQGFPDDYTQIPYRGKPAEECPDGPRYKALGNSMAVPVMRWIGQRIALIDALT